MTLVGLGHSSSPEVLPTVRIRGLVNVAFVVSVDRDIVVNATLIPDQAVGTA